MGWFSSPSPPAESTGPKPSSDGAYVAPNRNERAHCWEARDNFFQCLDRSNIIDSIKEEDRARQQCGKEEQEFEKNCASSWVTYFKKRRVVEYNKEETLKRLTAEGAQPLPEGVNLPAQPVKYKTIR